MAFTSAAGYGNLPNGVFVPEVFSQNVILAFRRVGIVSDITNTDYYGEIKQKGDTVRILVEPDVTVSDYVRGLELVDQDIEDTEITLTVDQAKYYSFVLDDLEIQQAHVDYGAMCANRAAYNLNNTYEQNILAAMYAGVASGNVEGTTGAPKTIGFDAGSDDYTPLEAINALARILDLQDVPNDGNRFLVANPYFFELLRKEDSKLIDASVMGDSQSAIKRPMGYQGTTISGIRLYQSNNAVTDTSKAVLLAGHKAATATAATLVKAETVRMEKKFGERHKGLMVFGRKVIRTNALAAMITDVSV